MNGNSGAVRHRVRILLVAPTFGAYGGVEAFVFALAATLRADPRFDVRVCFKEAPGFALHADMARACAGADVEFCYPRSRPLWRAVRWADLVHAQGASPDVALFALLHDRPLAVTFHNVRPRRPIVRHVAWRLAAASASARWYNSRYVWRSWEPRVRARHSAHVPLCPRLPHAYVPPEARRGFLFMGRLVAGKGADLLIAAYERAGFDPAEWPLTIAGDGPLRPALEAIVSARQIAGVHFTGFVAGEAKARALAGARWLVAPSHWHEPFGLVAVEARRLGVPCVVTNDGGLPEAGGRDAIVCASGDVAALTRALRTAAAMPLEEYRWRAMRARADLDDDVMPMWFYGNAYVRLLGEPFCAQHGIAEIVPARRADRRAPGSRKLA
jgi:glycosyltransferase involved in cell wall biosynthesis